MATLRVHDVLQDKILVSRESARVLENALGSALTGSGNAGGAITVDFAGVEGIAPSFLDELISIFEALLARETDRHERRLIVANPPTRLSSKFEAIARGHRMSIRTLADGGWLLADAADVSA